MHIPLYASTAPTCAMFLIAAPTFPSRFSIQTGASGFQRCLALAPSPGADRIRQAVCADDESQHFELQASDIGGLYQVRLGSGPS